MGPWGSVLSFKDDKAKRHEIFKRFGRIAGTAASVYRKTKGRANEQLAIGRSVKDSMCLEISSNHGRSLKVK